jgi:phospholipid/cholesterol/gamma-HCH transport system substrate-binding protein
MPSSRLIGVGAFIIGGLALFAVGLFLVGDRRGLFAHNFEIYTEFTKLAGLENGATVRVAGMDAGEVTEIHVPSGPTAKFRVRFRVREDLHPVVRTDSVASIQTEGVVGNKFLQVEGGSEKVPEAPANSTIPSRDPFDIADLLQQMSDTLAMVNKTIAEVQDDVQLAIRNISDTAAEARDLLHGSREDIDAILNDSRRISTYTRSVMNDISSGRGTIGKLVTDDSLYRQARDIVEQANSVMRTVREAAEQAQQAMKDLRSKGGEAQGIAVDLRETLAASRDAMSALAENAEALKHNFLFRGYFNQRGYFSLSDISAEEYRKGVLAGKDRAPLRIWLSADLVFARAPNGSEELTEGGKARLDSAMSQFLKYPQTSPLMIEGYSDQPTGDQRYLQCRNRATAVRNYLLAKFHLDPDRVGIMPLGSDAPDSPSGDKTWRGVALTLFVARSALQ